MYMSIKATPPLAVCASSGPGRSLWLSEAAEFPLPQSSAASPCAPLQPSTTISQTYAGPPSCARTLLHAKKRKNNLAVKLSDCALAWTWVINKKILSCSHHKIQLAQSLKLNRDIYWWDLASTAVLRVQSPFPPLGTRLLFFFFKSNKLETINGPVSRQRK